MCFQMKKNAADFFMDKVLPSLHIAWKTASKTTVTLNNIMEVMIQLQSFEFVYHWNHPILALLTLVCLHKLRLN